MLRRTEAGLRDPRVAQVREQGVLLLIFPMKLDLWSEERKVSNHWKVALEMVWIRTSGPQRTALDSTRQEQLNTLGAKPALPSTV